MTDDQMREYLIRMGKAAKLELDASDLVGLADNAISLGFPEFWESRPWSFRTKVYSLIIAAAADSFNLPSDFAQYRSVKEGKSTNGAQLRFLHYEEFEYRHPRLDTVADGIPIVFTVYRDLSANLYKIKFFPRPMAQTITLVYLSQCPASVSIVPANAYMALRVICESYLYPVYSDKFQLAMSAVKKVKDDLSQYDTPNGAIVFKFFDDTDYPTTSTTEFMSVNESS